MYSKEFELSNDYKRIKTEGKWRTLGSKNPYNIKVSFLVLDFNRAQETRNLLVSLRGKIKFKDYEIVLLSNGGDQSYLGEFYSSNLVDRLLIYNKNVGCGVATHDLFDSAKGEYSIYVQNDHSLERDFTQEELDKMISALNSDYQLIDLSGGAGHNDKYSERAHIIKTKTYQELPIKGFGGPGPFEEYFWSEAGASYSFWHLNYKIHHEWPLLFGNTGFRTVREDSEGIIIERYYQ